MATAPAPAPRPAPPAARTPAAAPGPGHPPGARHGRRPGRVSPSSPAAPASVWPHRRDDPQSTLATLIGAYTRPRDRVLLLLPAAPAGSDAGVDWPAQLTAAGPALTRLRRRIQVRTAAAPSNAGADPAPGPAGGSGAIRSPASTGSEPATGLSRSGRDSAGPQCTGPARAGLHRADLVVTAADPDGLDWIADPPWTTLLGRSGLLAVITHSDRPRGRWADPLAALTGLLAGAGLDWHDRIVLHHNPPEPPQPWTPGRPEPVVGHRRVHTDLLLFRLSRQPRPSGRKAGGRSA